MMYVKESMKKKVISSNNNDINNSRPACPSGSGLNLRLRSGFSTRSLCLQNLISTPFPVARIKYSGGSAFGERQPPTSC